MWKSHSIPQKNARNIRYRGLSFERAIDFDFATAALAIDSRREYGEVRYVAVGYLDGERRKGMKKRKPLTDEEGEVRELTSADLRDFRAPEEILSPSLLQKLNVSGCAPQETPTKAYFG